MKPVKILLVVFVFTTKSFAQDLTVLDSFSKAFANAYFYFELKSSKPYEALNTAVAYHFASYDDVMGQILSKVK